MFIQINNNCRDIIIVTSYGPCTTRFSDPPKVEIGKG